MTGTASALTPGGPWKAHAAVSAFFALLACAYSYPLVFHLSTHVPGPPGDNYAFLWNFWWTRHALVSSESLFHCPYMFAPVGTSLVLNTHTVIQSIGGATLLAPLSTVAAHNVVLLAGLAGNGIATYALAYAHVRRVMPAVLAGVVFSTSSYVGLHLLGHFNLVFAWVLPAAALAWTRYVARPAARTAAMVAISFAFLLYTDYYYFVFGLLFALIWTTMSVWQVSVEVGTARSRAAERVLLTSMGLVALAIAIIVATGGSELHVGGSRISVRGIRNPTTGLWILFLLWLALRLKVTVRRLPEVRLGPIVTSLSWVIVIGSALASPLLIPTMTMMAAGDYVGPMYRWRSASGGIDMLSLVAGSPMHAWYGPYVVRLFDRLDLGIIDQAAWIGLVPIVIGLVLVRSRRGWTVEHRRWLAVTIAFLVWSMGPFLLVSGHATGILLPQFFVRFVPILSNARIPGRGIVMVMLGSAMLCALVAAERGWRSRTLAALVMIALLDGLVAPYPLSAVPQAGRIEEHLAGDPRRGSVLPIPTGYQDGFAMVGQFDTVTFVRQMQHGRPIVGGYISRVPDRIKRFYDSRPAIAALIALSSPGAATRHIELPHDLARALAADGIAFVVVTRLDAPAPARAELERRGLTLILEEDERELYRVER